MSQQDIMAWFAALAIGGILRDVVGRFLSKGQTDVDVAHKAMQTASEALQELAKMRVELDEAHKHIRRLTSEVDRLTAEIEYYYGRTDI